jgi:hypothetical protein
MKGTLVRTVKDENYRLIDEKGLVIGSTIMREFAADNCIFRLDKGNCDVIYLDVVDDDKKNLYFYKQTMNSYPVESQSYTAYEKGFTEGFEKSLELNEEKVFTLEEMKQALFDLSDSLFNNCQNGISEEDCKKYTEDTIKSLGNPKGVGVDVMMEYDQRWPWIDLNGCLVLKKI